MIYKICTEKDSGILKKYLFENKAEIIPSAVDQMYANEAAVGMRLERGMEIAVLAVEEEDGAVWGIISAISPNMDNNWTIIALHVLERVRRQEIATELLQKLKAELLGRMDSVKCTASVMNYNKPAAACYLVNGFEYEGRISAVEKEKEMAVFGAVFIKEQEGCLC